MRIVRGLVLAATLFSAQMSCQRADLPNYVTLKAKWIMKTHPCLFALGKGGVGGIGTDVYVGTKSTRNKIMWRYEGSSKKWIGQESSKPEVVVFYDGNVWSAESLPIRFDKNKSVVVSFEKKHIRFYDFVQNTGCYYKRDAEN